MPKDKEEKPKVILEAVAEESAATVEDLVKVPEESVVVPPPPEVTMPVEITKVEGGGGKWTWVWAVVGLLLGIGVGAVLGFLVWGNKKEAVVVQPAAKAEPTKSADRPTLTPTAVVEVKRSDLKVKVLNGSGIKGAAGVVKELLESLGYKNVATANADGDDYEATEVTAAKGEYWEKVKADLESKYEVASKSGTAQLGEFDVVVILGGV